MRENEKQRGRRQAPDSSPFGGWWGRHRAWVAGLNRSQRLRYRLCLALGVVAVLAIALVLYLRSWIRLPDVPNVPGQVNNGQTGSQVDNSQGLPNLEYEEAQLPEVTRSGRKEGYYTFLVAGQDQVSGGTDTILLFTYDTRGRKISAISLLRDTMINTSASSKRLNAVYARNRGDRSLSEKERVANGMTALRQEVSKLTGIYPDFYVLVKWEAIGELVDAIGGVHFEVPFLMDYRDPFQDLVIYQEPGYRLLDGRDAMEVIRFRKNSDGTHILGDGGRTEIQRDFLTAVLKECLTPEILLKLPALAQVFLDNVSTDLTIGNILAFAQLAVGMDTENDVNFVSMPFDNVAYRGASLALARQDELLELLNGGLNPYLDEIKASDLQLMYRKSGGGYGVTNAVLADPAVGRAPAAKPKPEETDVKPGDDTDPGTTAAPGASEEPGTQTDPDSTDPGGTGDPADIGSIDPSDIFPDPSPDVMGGVVEDPLQPAA